MSHGPITHGHTRKGWASPEYVSWIAMRTRCRNPKTRQWRIYGGAGIRVCNRWENFENFLADMGPKPTPRHTLDRIDSKGNYEPGNCRWATYAEQNRNRVTARLITIDGATKCIAEWARDAGISDTSMGYRVKRGVTGRALLAPARLAKVNTEDERREMLRRQGWRV